MWLSVLDDAEASLAGSVGFRSHLHNGQRVATEYTIRPKETHFVLMQALTVQPPKITGGAAPLLTSNYHDNASSFVRLFR